MKTLVIITAALLISTASFADNLTSNKTLTIKDSFGRILTMPVKTEVAIEEMPFNQQEVLHQVRTENASKIFDISSMSHPETAVDDIPAELRSVIRQ